MRRLTSLLIVLVLSACAYSGGGDNPAVRKFTWFSMVNGDDIRGRCAETANPEKAGAARPGYERYRLIYNAVYSEQVRVYELNRGPKDGNVLKAQVTSSANLADGVELSDLLKPWRPKTDQTFLDDATFNKLVGQFEASGLFKGAPKGLDLPSDSFFWTAVGCRNGEIHFSAWKYPSTEFSALAFDKLLFAIDQTGVKVNPPRHPLSNFLPQRGNSGSDSFLMTVGDNGLAGVSRLF
jgi:hypothetical protein